MEWEELLHFFQIGENEHTVFIPTIQNEKDLGPTLVAFSNKKNGGQIVIGVDIVNYHLIGTSIDQKWIESLIQNFCNPVFNVKIDSINRNEKTIISVQVSEGKHKPYTFLRKCYVRDAQETRLATVDEDQYFYDHSLLKPAPLLEEPLETEALEPSEQTSCAQHNQQEFEIQSHLHAIVDEEPTIQHNEISGFQLLSSTPSSETVSQLNKRQKLALEHLKKFPHIKNKEYRSLFGVSHKTAHIELVQLVSHGHLVSQGGGRNTHYVLRVT